MCSEEALSRNIFKNSSSKIIEKNLSTGQMVSTNGQPLYNLGSERWFIIESSKCMQSVT